MSQERSREKRTILVIDDDPAFRAKLGRVLSGAGYDVVEAGDADAALIEIEARGDGIDLMVVDLCLPKDQSGLDVIAAATRRRLRAKIIAASGVYDELYLGMAQELGADIAIRKPREDDVTAWPLDAIRSLLGEFAPAAAPTQRLVVVAEDEEAVRHMVKMILQRGGYQVLEAADGAAALRLIEKIGGSLDLLITDYEMPCLNGIELVRGMRAKYPDVPVLYMSGWTGAAEREEMEDPARHCAFMPKPFFPRALLDLVRLMTDEAQRAAK